MKTRNAILWSVGVALALLLGAGTAHAQQLVFGDQNEPEKATGILNLDVPGFGTFDVAFRTGWTAAEIYGEFPGDEVGLPPFLTYAATEEAADQVNALLNAQNVFEVGEVGVAGVEAYNIGATAFICCTLPFIDDDPEIPAITVARSVTEGGADWFAGENFLTWAADDGRTWAVFTPSGGAVCGNGAVEGGEQCDDGNTTPGDGCSATCTFEGAVCGNRVVEAGEECDDGNTTGGDGCSASCQLEMAPVCGNNIVEGSEQCDDGNLTPGDGCSATCTVEPGQEAQLVLDPNDLNKAIGVTNLEVSGFGTFDVAFDQGAVANQIYGSFPGDQVGLPPFLTYVGAETAAAAINVLLNAENIFEIGEAGFEGVEGYNIGAVAFLCCGDEPDVQSIVVARSVTEGGADWFAEENFITWNADERPWAVFTRVPEPSASLLSVAALATLGLIRRKRRKGSEGPA